MSCKPPAAPGGSNLNQNEQMIKETVLWKIFEMIFVIAFFCKDDNDVAGSYIQSNQKIFDLSINNLS